MTKTLNRIIVILALSLAIIAMFFIKNWMDKKYAPPIIDSVRIDTIFKIDTIFQDRIQYTTVYVPQYIYLTDSTRFYSDTINDQNYQVTIADTVKGSIESRKVGVRLFVPEKITIEKEVIKQVPVIVTKEPEKSIQFYYGLTVPVSIKYAGFTPQFEAVTPSGWKFGIGYTISRQGNYPVFMVSKRL